jgi:hypothetical protein
MESDFFDDDAPEAFCDYEGMYDREHAKVAALEAQLKALDWTPITDENLPKPGDELFARHVFRDAQWNCVSSVTSVHATWRASDFLNCGWTHFRPINPPQPSVSTGDAGTNGGKA